MVCTVKMVLRQERVVCEISPDLQLYYILLSSSCRLLYFIICIGFPYPLLFDFIISQKDINHCVSCKTFLLPFSVQTVVINRHFEFKYLTYFPLAKTNSYVNLKLFNKAGGNGNYKWPTYDQKIRKATNWPHCCGF